MYAVETMESVEQAVELVVLRGLPDVVEKILRVGDVETPHANLGNLDPGCAVRALVLSAHALAY